MFNLAIILSIVDDLKIPELSDDRKEELKEEVADIFKTLMKRYPELSGESLLLASTYIAGKRLGLCIDPLQINKTYGTTDTIWLDMLDILEAEAMKLWKEKRKR